MYLFTPPSSCSIHFDPLSFWSQTNLRWIRVALLFLINTRKAFTGLFLNIPDSEISTWFSEAVFLNEHLHYYWFYSLKPFKSLLKVFPAWQTPFSWRLHIPPLLFLSPVPPLSSTCLSVIRLLLSCMKSANGLTAQLLSFTARAVLVTSARIDSYPLWSAVFGYYAQVLRLWLVCTWKRALFAENLLT